MSPFLNEIILNKQGKQVVQVPSWRATTESFHQWCEIISLPVTSRVPQGSILGSLLFIIFITDLTLNVTNKSMYIYADDTTQVVAGHNVMEVASTLEKALETSTLGSK